MTPTNDGGQIALAGYLYQTVGTLGLRAMAHTAPDTANAEEIETLLYLVRDGDLELERLGQDAIIWLRRLGVDSNDECTLIQFKFSLSASPRKLGAQELREIAVKLTASVEDAQARRLTASGTAIITNRQLTDEAVDLASNAAPDHRYVGNLSPAQIDVLKKTRIPGPIDSSVWTDALTRFAESYGVLPNEIQGGVKTLVGDMFIKTAREMNRFVTRAGLVEAFTGVRDAQPLTVSCVVKDTQDAIKKSRNQFGADRKPIRRELLDEIVREANQHALIVLEGEGGTGKSVALWEWANEVVSTVPAHGGAFTKIVSAKDVPENWIVDTVCKWRSISSYSRFCRDNDDEAVERLKTANATASHPILHLGLDGLDEEIADHHVIAAVNAVVRTFNREEDVTQSTALPPRMTLVVTCRKAKDFSDKWIQRDVAGYGDLEVASRIIRMGDFTNSELLEAIRNELPDQFETASRVIQTTGVHGTAVFGGQSSIPTAGHPIDSEILESLRHPMMWGAFQRLQPVEKLRTPNKTVGWH